MSEQNCGDYLEGFVMASCMKCKRTGFGFLEIKSGLCPSCRRSLEVAEEAKTREQRQRTKAETDQINSKIDAIVLTTETAPNLNITKRIDIISAQAAFEINNFKDLFVGFMNPVRGRSNELERQLEELRVQSSQKLKAKAYELGANGIVAVDLDLSTVTIGGISMMMMMASGTAVVIED